MTTTTTTTTTSTNTTTNTYVLLLSTKESVCWWHMKDGAVLGVHNGANNTYSRTH